MNSNHLATRLVLKDYADIVEKYCGARGRMVEFLAFENINTAYWGVWGFILSMT